MKEKVLVRMSFSVRNNLWRILFSRYPCQEWGSFIRVGWRETSLGLMLTVKSIDDPLPGDLDEGTWITTIQAQYTRRILRMVESHDYGVGFVHSHPLDFLTHPSASDLNMEDYYSQLLKGYASNRPFISLIFSRSEDGFFSGSGRVWWRGQWLDVTKFAIENTPIRLYDFHKPSALSSDVLKRMARFTSAFGIEAAEILAGSTVGIVGVSGTGSPIVESLARANIGRIIAIDPETFDDSNFERNHASTIDDIGTDIPKVKLARRFVKSLNGDCEVISIQGRLPQKLVLDYLLLADVVLGCTDQHSARIALTDISTRYLMPVIDVGVKMEGKDGKLTGQVLQINKIFPDDPCVYCRDMVNSKLAAQELMSDEEKAERRAEAEKAKKEKRHPNAYWIDVPQLNTVGYLTTMAGSLVSAYTIGYLTGRFPMPNNRIDIALTPIGISLVERNESPKAACICNSARGCADQDPTAVVSSAPNHWPQPIIHGA